MPIRHATGITFEIVGIEASNNSRSCDRIDVCGSAIDDDAVVRLRRKVQILNRQEREEIAIAAYNRIESISVVLAFCNATLWHI